MKVNEYYNNIFKRLCRLPNINPAIARVQPFPYRSIQFCPIRGIRSPSHTKRSSYFGRSLQDRFSISLEKVRVFERGLVSMKRGTEMIRRQSTKILRLTRTCRTNRLGTEGAELSPLLFIGPDREEVMRKSERYSTWGSGMDNPQLTVQRTHGGRVMRRLGVMAPVLIVVLAILFQVAEATQTAAPGTPAGLVGLAETLGQEAQKVQEVMREGVPKELLPAPPRSAPPAQDAAAAKSAPPEKPIEKEESKQLSRIELILSGQFPTDISRELRQFGYDFFDPQVSTFAPVTNVPVGPDYVIGPGDSFTINLWGKAENRFDAEVDREGRISLPQVGTVTVSGLRFEELKPFLYRRFKEYHPDFHISVTMGRLRTVEVFVVGEARKPGTYTVSSLSTVITSLYAAGGPSKNGSLRNVQVFRQGEKVKSIDLYDFLVHGAKKDDIRLQSQDTLFVPVLGPVIGVAGNVRRPAIYEMKGGETIRDAIALAGGVLPTGELQNVVVERMVGNRKRVIGSFNLDPSSIKAEEDLKASLQDGDVIKIYPIHGAIGKVVRLEGHVKYPREYEWKPDMRLRDIIPSYSALLPEPYLPQAEIIRLVPPDSHPEIIPFDLGALLSGHAGREPSASGHGPGDRLWRLGKKGCAPGEYQRGGPQRRHLSPPQGDDRKGPHLPGREPERQSLPPGGESGSGCGRKERDRHGQDPFFTGEGPGGGPQGEYRAPG